MIKAVKVSYTTPDGTMVKEEVKVQVVPNIRDTMVIDGVEYTVLRRVHDTDTWVFHLELI